MKLVSIIITSYNLEDLIEKSIKSCLNQTYENTEVIVVDDFSTDKTISKIEKLNKNNNFKFIKKKENKGISNSRNEGLKHAKGDFIMFVDGDDYIKENMVFDMISAFNKYDVDVVDSRQIFTVNKNDNKYYWTMDKYNKNKDIILFNKDDILKSIRYVHGKLYKREVLKDIYFDENFNVYEDQLFNYSVVNNIKKYVLLNELYYFYLQRNDSLINTYNENHLQFINLYNKLYSNNKLINKLLYNDLLGIILVKTPRMNIDDTKKLNIFLKFVNTSKDNTLLIKMLKNKIIAKLYIKIFKHVDFVKLAFLINMKVKRVKI